MTLSLALAGCGGSTTPSNSAHTSSTPTPRLHTATGGPLATTINLKSPALGADGALSSENTCDGKNASLPLTWSNIPPHTAELVLFVINGEVAKGNLFMRHVEWGVAGLKPSLSGVEGGALPPGSIVGHNDNDNAKYSMCPTKGPAQGYAALLYALPHPIKVAPGFNAATLRERVASLASAGGVLITHYQRHSSGATS